MDKELFGILFVGALLTLMGVLNWRGNVSTIHWYHRARICPEDIPRYGRVMGAATVTIGLTVVAAGVLEKVFALVAVSYGVLALGLAAGFGLILYGQFKYNGGLF